MTDLDTIDDFPNITANFSEEQYVHQESTYERIFLELFTVVGLLSVTANVFQIFVILKYRKLREDVTNVIFLHLNILQALYLLVTPLTLRISMLILHYSHVYVMVFCISYQLEAVLMFALTWFLFLLIFGWLLKLYFENTHRKFLRVYKFFIICLYVLMVIYASLCVHSCFTFTTNLVAFLSLLVGLVLIFLFLIIVNIVHFIKKRKVATQRKVTSGLAIANIFFFLWVPTIILLLLSLFGNFKFPLTIIFTIMLGFSSPIFTIIYLYFYDDNYHVFLKQVFTCNCHVYKNENLNDTSVSFNDVEGVRISR